MWKILLVLLLISSPAWAVSNQWRGGVGTQELDGTQAANLIGFNSYNHIVQPLDNLLSIYCNEYLAYASSSTITVVAGSCVDSNSQGTIRLFMMDTTNTTLTSANLDTGSILASTTYYVYSTAASSSATTSTYYISASNTAPSGATYYYKIGSFTTDSSSNFTTINNTYIGQEFNAWSSKSSGVVYQALTDGFIVGWNNINTNQSISCTTDSSSSPTTVRSQAAFGGSANQNGTGTCMSPVRKGDYYEFVLGGGGGAAYYLSTNH